MIKIMIILIIKVTVVTLSMLEKVYAPGFLFLNISFCLKNLVN